LGEASDLLSEAGRIHAMDDVIVHPDTLANLNLEQGKLVVVAGSEEAEYEVGLRTDVSPGVIFVSKRGTAGDLSNVTTAELKGGQ